MSYLCQESLWYHHQATLGKWLAYLFFCILKKKNADVCEKVILGTCHANDTMTDNDTKIYQEYRRTSEQHLDALKKQKMNHMCAKGANNTVYKIVYDHQVCALRVPRRGSDTQKRMCGCQELRNTLEAARLGVSPHVYDIWLLRHRTKSYPSGLYMITDFIKHDLDSCMKHKTKFVMTHASTIGNAVVKHLETLAKNGLFVFDLKPSNILISDSDCNVKMIDFGSDFCEKLDKNNASTNPTIHAVRCMVQKNVVDDSQVDALCKHILFGVMLMQLSSTTTTFLYSERHRENTTAELRRKLHPFASLANSFIKSLRACHLHILREVLRLEPIKGVLQHYNSRKYSGTGWTLRLACGHEKKRATSVA